MIDKTTTQSAFKDNPDFETTDWPLMVEMMLESLNGDAEDQKDESYDPFYDTSIPREVQWARIIRFDLNNYKLRSSYYKRLYEGIKATGPDFELKKCQDELAVFKDLYVHEKEVNQKLREELTRATSDRHKENMEESE